ncbi:type 2 isopentenyl-diphosphate Delta-isomerase [Texcoconibacillus texcoconensis]|uniref:Isopentenyl-diphosphate delta-isomerase n=1 Tax=Texcoconibacillus texcoconensis TaxID=1095777 RepID=A0A840QNG1_9BACI|nr:type 2 isopentenyl-diphosphate Delta-isomerase [Texcoconibacillus texcoconensis]MBB5172909.1 isopentenyl-diphosphate delta-isomerase [Texcoconibacillus texcoconensis]
MSRQQRKIDHIDHALQVSLQQSSGFSDVHIVHQPLPETDVASVDLSVELGELSFSSPFYINAMTGGGGERTEKLNGDLAEVARELDIPIAVGSQMAALKNDSERSTYKVIRDRCPNGIVFANVGSEATVDQARASIDMIEANALQVHLNVIQELVMPEGDRTFTGTIKKVESIVQSTDVPVIVKEVGFGINREAARQLAEVGVSVIDVAGSGGTNFAEIENRRRKDPYTHFENWGIPTAVSVAEVASEQLPVSLVASGGIRDSLDIIKSITLGADAVAMAGPVLKSVESNGVASTIEWLNHIREEMKMYMTALGAPTIHTLQKTPIVLSGFVHHWLQERGVDTKHYTQSSR